MISSNKNSLLKKTTTHALNPTLKQLHGLNAKIINKAENSETARKAAKTVTRAATKETSKELNKRAAITNVKETNAKEAPKKTNKEVSREMSGKLPRATSKEPQKKIFGGMFSAAISKSNDEYASHLTDYSGKHHETAETNYTLKAKHPLRTSSHILLVAALLMSATNVTASNYDIEMEEGNELCQGTCLSHER